MGEDREGLWHECVNLNMFIYINTFKNIYISRADPVMNVCKHSSPVTTCKGLTQRDNLLSAH